MPSSPVIPCMEKLRKRLRKNDPYHKVVTNYQRHIVKGMEVGDSKLVDWPFFTDNIYPN